MYVVHVVQGANGRLGLAHTPARHTRSLSADATGVNQGVIYVPPSAEVQKLQPSALSAQPSSTQQGGKALMPWLGQFVHLMHASPAHSTSHAAVMVRASHPHKDMTTTSSATDAALGNSQQQQQVPAERASNPFVIHLPGGEGRQDLAYGTDNPANAGIPNTPAIVVDSSSSLAVWGPEPPAALQHSTARPTSLQGRAPAAPAPAPAGGPWGLFALPALQWNSNGSSGSSMQWWGSPIGGTLHINPPLPPEEGPAATATGAGAPAVAHAPPSALQRRSTPGVPAKPKPANMALLPPALQQARGRASAIARQPSGAGSSMQWWGSPLGGTVYINPPLMDWQDGSSQWGGGGGNMRPGGGQGGGGGSGAALGSGISGSKVAGSGPGGRSSSSSSSSGTRGPSSGRLSSTALPVGVGLARLGVALMAAVAAGAMAVLYAKKEDGSSNDGRLAAVGAMGVASDSTTGAAATAVPDSSRAATGAANVGGSGGGTGRGGSIGDGPGYHQWMMERLSFTLAGFESEQAMLRAELALLSSLPAARSGGRQGLWNGVARLFGSSGSNVGMGADAGAMEAAVSAAQQPVGLSAAEVSARVSEIREQLESLDTLKAALSAELREHKQQLQHEAQAHHRAVQQQQRQHQEQDDRVLALR